MIQAKLSTFQVSDFSGRDLGFLALFPSRNPWDLKMLYFGYFLCSIPALFGKALLQFYF